MGKHFISGFIGAIVGALVVIIFMGVFFTFPPPKVSTTPSPSTGEAASDSRDESVITRAVEKISPSVVNIDTKTFVQYSVPSSDPFGRFFGFPPYESRVVPQMGSGSGVIISPEGLILTNEHVIHGASEIMVTLPGDLHVPGKIKGADQISDLALVQIEAKDLVAATLGDSDRLLIGATVIAVGNPYKFEHTVTVGVLSGRERSISEQTKDLQDLLQTDAAINPGNSGGPLVNVRGEVIGINTAIVPFAQGIGFAIPINTAKNVMQQLLARGRVSRPYLGIYMQDMNEHVGQQLGIPLKEGVIIVATLPGGPAEQARLLPKDVITRFNGKKVKSADELRKMLKGTGIGDRITLKIWRTGHEGDVSLVVGEAPK